MRRVSTLLGILVSALTLMSGLYILYVAGLNQAVYADALLITGAVMFTLGMINLITGIRSIIWHRRMLKQTRPEMLLP